MIEDCCLERLLLNATTIISKGIRTLPLVTDATMVQQSCPDDIFALMSEELLHIAVEAKTQKQLDIGLCLRLATQPKVCRVI